MPSPRQLSDDPERWFTGDRALAIAAMLALCGLAWAYLLYLPRPRSEFFGFVGGYVSVWSGFSLLATLLQWALLEARLVSPTMQASSRWLSGTLLLAAGLYQLTPLKHACLTRCRSPLAFLTEEWRKGLRGALIMGVRHGLACVGCCWLVMLLLFVLGIMNVVWIAVLAAFALAEKTLPNSRWLNRSGGLILVGWGVAVLLAG